jgi:hypothetical protein
MLTTYKNALTSRGAAARRPRAGLPPTRRCGRGPAAAESPSAAASHRGRRPRGTWPRSSPRRRPRGSRPHASAHARARCTWSRGTAAAPANSGSPPPPPPLAVMICGGALRHVVVASTRRLIRGDPFFPCISIAERSTRAGGNVPVRDQIGRTSWHWQARLQPNAHRPARAARVVGFLLFYHGWSTSVHITARQSAFQLNILLIFLLISIALHNISVPYLPGFLSISKR